MKKYNAFIISSLSLSFLLVACQPPDEQSSQETGQHSSNNISENVKKDMEAAYKNKDAFKRTVSIGTTEITLPLRGLYLNEN
ncbi:hypothetical protein AWH48_01165 [Domibacillus aminovorans]|uniref:Lipoprotein n=1 Tax=Domibacillus aminovorans TaxID=29332 RepID=A0A177KWC1_9BACI|nr:hypothetical protein [Domibacillus aminovorans]OAH57658.1 hypothetical protein AWH48_01165 [Domibacillus aminovorans]